MRTIVVVGVGALGSHVVPLIRNVPAQIRVVDFDRVEAKNVQSQFHGKPHVGRLKVHSLSASMDLLFGVKLSNFPHKLVHTNALQLLGYSDLLVDCLDNAASRRIVQQAKIPSVHAAVDAAGSFGRVCWDEHFVIDEEDADGAPTCENGEHLPFIGMVAAHLAHAIREFIVYDRRISYQISPGGTVRV